MNPKPRERRPTILIVDDERTVFDVISRILAELGCRTVWAESGGRALAVAPATNPDLIILDLHLPDCNGLQILGRLKTTCKEAPVIVLTGFGSGHTARAAMVAGVFEYLTKPFDPQELRAIVRAALEAGNVLQGAVEEKCVRQ